MKKAALVLGAVFVVLVGLLVLVVGGAFMYANKNEADNAFKVNVAELTKKENTSKMTVTDNSSGSLEVYMKGELAVLYMSGSEGTEISLNDEQLISDEIMNESSELVIDVENKKVITTSQDGEESEQTLEEYDQNSILSDTELWEKIADEKEYKVEETELDGEKVWKYTINSMDLKKEFQEMMNKTLGESMADPSLTISSSTVEFDGDIIITVYIGREDYEAKKLVAETTKPITVKMVGSTQIPDLGPVGFEMRSVLSDFKISQTVNEIVLKDGKNAPSNSFLLMLAAMQ